MNTQKEVDLGNGCTVWMASLTFDQVEDLLEKPIPEDAKGNRERSWYEIMLCVNNYPGQETLTRADIVAKLTTAFTSLDAVTKAQQLRREGLLLSGYKLEEAKAKVTPQGEAMAAATEQSVQ